MVPSWFRLGDRGLRSSVVGMSVSFRSALEMAVKRVARDHGGMMGSRLRFVDKSSVWCDDASFMVGHFWCDVVSGGVGFQCEVEVFVPISEDADRRLVEGMKVHWEYVSR